MGDRERLVEMLRRFREAQETLLCGEGSSGNPRLMPRSWTPEMRELERCLGLLGRRRPKAHRHVMARFVDPVLGRRLLVGRVQRVAGGEAMVWPGLGPCAEVRSFAKVPELGRANEYTCLVASWPAWVNKPTVELGLDFLEREYRAPNQAVGPALPAEMVAA